MNCFSGIIGLGSYYYYDCCGVLTNGINNSGIPLNVTYVDFSKPYSSNVVKYGGTQSQVCPSSSPTPTPTQTPTQTVTQTPTPTPTPTPSQTQIAQSTLRTTVVSVPVNSCDVFTLFPLELMCDVTDASNSTSFDGTVGVITNGGGTPPYFYTWNNLNTTPYLYNVSAGTYTVTVTDVRGDFNETITCTVGYNLACGINATITPFTAG